jgi:hypothetical protein
MIAHPFDVRNCLNIFGELAKQIRFIHLFKENSFPRTDLRIASRLHRKMEDDFLPFPVSLPGKGFRITSERKNGKGDREIPTKEFLGNLIFSPEVVNDNSDLWAKTHPQRRWKRADKCKLMSDSSQNPDLQMERFRFLGGLNRNGSPERRKASPQISFDQGEGKGRENPDLQGRLFPGQASLFL